MDLTCPMMSLMNYWTWASGSMIPKRKYKSMPKQFEHSSVDSHGNSSIK